MGDPVKTGNNVNLIIFLSKRTAVLGIDLMFFFNKCSMYYGTKFNEPLLFFLNGGLKDSLLNRHVKSCISFLLYSYDSSSSSAISL